MYIYWDSEIEREVLNKLIHLISCIEHVAAFFFIVCPQIGMMLDHHLHFVMKNLCKSVSSISSLISVDSQDFNFLRLRFQKCPCFQYQCFKHCVVFLSFSACVPFSCFGYLQFTLTIMFCFLLKNSIPAMLRTAFDCTLLNRGNKCDFCFKVLFLWNHFLTDKV